MMFNNPPLVELVAEVRWTTPSRAVTVPGALPAAHMGQMSGFWNVGVADPAFFQFFATGLAARGYSNAERLVPAGFPILPYQAVVRFRKNPPAPGSMPEGTRLFQIGPQVLSVNAAPPYQSWDRFRPEVEIGVATLIESLRQAGATNNFEAVHLTYIDAYTQSYLNGQSSLDFLATLGLGIGLPDIVRKLSENDQSTRCVLQLNLPLTKGGRLAIGAHEGIHNGETALLVRTSVNIAGEFAQCADDIMAIFDDAHDTIRSIFFEMTKPIHAVMQPTG